MVNAGGCCSYPLLDVKHQSSHPASLLQENGLTTRVMAVIHGRRKEKKFPPTGIFQALPAESPEAAWPDPRAGPASGTGLDQTHFPPTGLN